VGYRGPMNLRILFLGTGAWAPTPERGAAAVMILRGGEHILVDCGEGTQRQMMLSRGGMGRLSTILVTHCHPDHVLGLPGLLATFSDARDKPLSVLGPHGLSDLMTSFRTYHGRLAFPLHVIEVTPGDALVRGGYRLEALSTDHDCASVGWAMVEDPRPGHLDAESARAQGVRAGPDLGRLARGEDLVFDDGRRLPAEGMVGPPERGRRLVFSGDTRPCAAVECAAGGADVLVHEATFLDRDADLAAAGAHTTAQQAAELGSRAGVRMLALTHISHRYEADEVANEAHAAHPAAAVPDDFDIIEVPLPESGRPRLRRGAGRATSA
jgi:ribonuclease Z